MVIIKNHRVTEKSLLVLRLSALGDVIHTIPAVVALRDALPQTRIGWVVEAAYRELVSLVARVAPIPVALKKWPRAPVQSWPDAMSALRTIGEFEASLDFQGLMKSGVIAWLSGAARRYGFERDVLREKQAAWFINRPLVVDGDQHVVDLNMQLARGIAGDVPMPDVDFAPFAAVEGFEELRDAIVILPGAGKPDKQWPPDRFAELVEAFGNRVVAVPGPGETALAEATTARVAPPTTLRQLARILANAAVVVGGDTGPLHLAAALGTRVIGLYGPTSPRRNGPYGQLDRVISTFDTSRTMDGIGARDVVAAVGRALSDPSGS